MPSGHYTSLSATGPTGDRLWYTGEGWSSSESDKLVFNQVHVTVHTAIQGLPSGYHTSVNFEVIEIEAQPEPPLNPCGG